MNSPNPAYYEAMATARGVRPTPARSWAILLTSANHGTVGPLGSTFPHAGEHHERVVVVEVPAGAGAPSDEVNLVLRAAPAAKAGGDAEAALSNERIEELWDETPTADAETFREVRYRFARAIEREVAAQAGQVAPADLHDAIMLLRETSPYDPVRHSTEHVAYKCGHRDARHAAAELATGFEAGQVAPVADMTKEQIVHRAIVELRVFAPHELRQDGQVAVPEGFALMPRRLTAENGAKSLLIGEFSESTRVTCHECDGSGEDSEYDSGCVECGGEGTIEQKVAVEWDTIKRIYDMAVQHLAAAPSAPAVAQQAPAQAEPSASQITDTTSARKFVDAWHRKHFPTDRTFSRYIMADPARSNPLAGDFAWQLAKALESLGFVAQASIPDVRSQEGGAA